MTGYVRTDVTNEISNGNVIDAAPLAAEFNALQVAFSETTGHKHDGTVGEGSPITVVGPVQDVIVSSTSVVPKTTNTIDLGTATFRWKLLNSVSVIANSVATDILLVDGVPAVTESAAATLTNKTIDLTSNTLVATSAQIASAITDETGTGQLVFSDSPELVGIPTAPTPVISTNTNQIATTAFVKSFVNDAFIGPLSVAQGGTGTSTLTDNAVLIGNGTGPITGVVGTQPDQVLTWDGTDWGAGEALEFTKPGDYVTSWRPLNLPRFLPAEGESVTYLRSDYLQVPAETPGNFGAFTSVTIPASTGNYAIDTDGAGVWIIVGNNGYMIRSSDNGLTWTTISSGFSGLIYSVATDKNGTWLAGDQNGNIRRSTNNGLNWFAVTSGFGVANVRSIATNGQGVWIAVGGQRNARRSSDNGVTWSSISVGGTIDVIYSCVATDNNGVWVVGSNSATAARSVDNGLTWTSVLTGLSSHTSVKTDDKGVWVVTGSGSDSDIKRSIDNGLFWNPVLTTPFNFLSLATDKKGDWIACGANGVGVRSLNNGLDWGRINTSFGNQNVSAVVTDSNGVWIATNSTDGTAARSATNPLLFVVRKSSDVPSYMFTGEPL